MAIETPEAPLDGDAEHQSGNWRPSRPPEHRLAAETAHQGKIIEQQEELTSLGLLFRFLQRPFVKLVIGLGVFILAAMIYDATVNYGSWTAKEEEPKPGRHRGANPIPLAPG